MALVLLGLTTTAEAAANFPRPAGVDAYQLTPGGGSGSSAADLATGTAGGKRVAATRWSGCPLWTRSDNDFAAVAGQGHAPALTGRP